MISIKFKFQSDEEVSSALNEAVYIMSTLSSQDPSIMSTAKVKDMSTKWVTKWLEQLEEPDKKIIQDVS